MRLYWTRPARIDLDGIVRYIADDSPTAALDSEDQVWAAAKRLEDMPDSGRIGRVPGTRELIVNHTPYLVIYRVVENQVEALRVIHGAQDWPPREN